MPILIITYFPQLATSLYFCFFDFFDFFFVVPVTNQTLVMESITYTFRFMIYKTETACVTSSVFYMRTAAKTPNFR